LSDLAVRPSGSSWVQRRTVLAWPFAVAAGSGCEGQARRAQPPAAPDEEIAFQFDPRFFTRRPSGRAPGPAVGAASPAQRWAGWSPMHGVPGDRAQGQTFLAYVTGRPVRPTPTRTSIVLQPLGPSLSSARHRRLLDALAEFAGLFFGLPARLEPALPLPPYGYRVWDTGGGARPQYRTGVLLDRVLAPRLPEDAVAYLGVTMADLYPAPSWSFVFGEASLERRVGVLSMLRLSSEPADRPDSPAARALLLRRACKTLAHETGHVFSLRHCPYYECVMNSCATLDELDRAPGWLCPICLRKLHWNLDFSLVERYRRLSGFDRRSGLFDWAAWMEARRALLQPL
jgi:archaemetzincin